MSGGSGGGNGGGAGGSSNPLGTGGMGGPGTHGYGGGGGGDGATGGAGGNGVGGTGAAVSGGPGATNPGGAGGSGAYGSGRGDESFSGGGGSGGGGGATGLVATSSTTVDEATFGGAGGRGGEGAYYGGGGGGGADGAALSGSGLTVTVQRGSGLFGGAGGDGGNGLLYGGSGGGGGGGIFAGNGNTIVNNGTIIGGSGGAGGYASKNGVPGSGGVAIVGSNLAITNTGLISGGVSGDGSTQADAIDFTSGTNSLSLGGAIDGGIALSGSLAITTTRDTTLADAIRNYSNGAGSLAYDSANTLTLSAANTYSGGTNIDKGTVSLAHSTGAVIDAAGTGAIAVFGGTALELATSSTLSNEVNFDSGTGTMEAATGVTATVAGAFTDLNATRIVFGSKTATGTIVLASSNVAVSSTSAPTIEIAGGSLRDGGYLNSLFDLPFNSDPVIVQIDSGATLDLNGYADQIQTLAGSGTLTNAAGGSVTIDGGTFAGVIAGGGNVVIGSGATVTLTGLNTYTGNTSVSGTLALSGSGSIAASGAVNLAASAAALDISGTTSPVSINNLGGMSGSLVDLGAGTLTVNENVAGTFAGVIQDGGAAGGTGGNLVVAGSAALTLTGVESYSGRTSVSGTLDLSGAGSIQTSTKAALTKSGATLDISGETTGTVVQKLGGIAGTVTDLGSQNLKIKVKSGTIDSYAGTIKDGGVAGGTGGSVTLGGQGELSLTAANSYTGGTTIDAGTLDLAALGAAGSGTITFANPVANGVATLEIDAAALSGSNGSYTFANKIAGATTTNQVIDLRSLSYVQGSTSAKVVGGTGLVVNDGSSTVTLTLASSSSKSTFVTASDGHGGTLVYDPPATPTHAAATAEIDTHWIEMAMADFGGVAGDRHAHGTMHDAFGHGTAAPFEPHHGLFDKAHRLA